MEIIDRVDATDAEPRSEELPSRIVVPLSGSSHAMRAVPHAIELAAGSTRPCRCSPCQTRSSTTERSTVPSWLHMLRDRVELERVELVVTEPGDRARMILDLVHASEHAALCFATHARHGVSELVHHRVAQTVLRSVRTPAWVVGRDCTRHPRRGPIMVCREDSQAADAMVETARVWGLALGARFDDCTDMIEVRSGLTIEAITDLARSARACAIAVALPPAVDDARAIGDLVTGLIRESPCPVLAARGDGG